MKEHLETRIKELEQDYNFKLTQPAKSGSNIDDSSKKVQWCETECIRARLLEVRDIYKFFLENNYTNS